MKKRAFILLFAIMFSANGQEDTIEAPKGYTNTIGQMISMLDDLKSRVVRNVKNLSQKDTDFLLDDNANSPGAIIYHLAATEAYYQVYTFEGRLFNKEEAKKWNTALNLGATARQEFKGKPMSYYLRIYHEVRKKTKALLKTKDDAWFAKNTGSMNNHWAWFHVMEHQANHMGQLAMIVKRI